MRLEIKDLRVHYGKIEAIKGVSVVVNEGEIVTLIGANGAGKTTMLKTISGLRPVTSGQILFNGEDISKMPAYKRADLGLAQAPEGRGIFVGMTVLENLEMGKYNRKDRKKEMAEDLERFTTYSHVSRSVHSKLAELCQVESSRCLLLVAHLCHVQRFCCLMSLLWVLLL